MSNDDEIKFNSNELGMQLSGPLISHVSEPVENKMKGITHLLTTRKKSHP